MGGAVSKRFKKSILFIFLISTFTYSCDQSQLTPPMQELEEPNPENADRDNPRDNLESRPNPTFFPNGLSIDGSGTTFEEEDLFNNIPQYCDDSLASAEIDLHGFQALGHEMTFRIGDIEAYFRPDPIRSTSEASCECEVETVSLWERYPTNFEEIVEHYSLCIDSRSCPSGSDRQVVGQVQTVMECENPVLGQVSFLNYDRLLNSDRYADGGDRDLSLLAFQYGDEACLSLESSRTNWDLDLLNREIDFENRLDAFFLETGREMPLELQYQNWPEPAQHILTLVLWPMEASGIYSVQKEVRFYDEDSLDFGQKRISGALLEPQVGGCLVDRREVHYQAYVSVMGNYIPLDGLTPSVRTPDGIELIDLGENSEDALAALRIHQDPLSHVSDCIKEKVQYIYKETVDDWYENSPVPYIDLISEEGNELKSKDIDGDRACNLLDWCDDEMLSANQKILDPNRRRMFEAWGRFVDFRDRDGDQIPDICDFCINEESQSPWAESELGRLAQIQEDRDDDGIGDDCDYCEGDDRVLDIDRDTFCNAVDNCPTIYNHRQWDTDQDGIGNPCDPCKLHHQADLNLEALNDFGICTTYDDFEEENLYDYNPISDYDGDYVRNGLDNCIFMANPEQEDHDEDGFGNVCDPDCDVSFFQEEEFCVLDADNDGINNSADNCRYTSNPDQIDSNLNGVGDACEGCDDLDFNQICDEFEASDLDGDDIRDEDDNCPDVFNPQQFDFDFDGHGDACDNCPDVSNFNQNDQNNNGVGNACEEEACDDINRDGFCEDWERDDDDDGVANLNDNCRLTENPDQADDDRDGVGDACDQVDNNDLDGDGVLNEDDNCPHDGNPDQRDENRNEIGDDCDPSCNYNERGLLTCIEDDDLDRIPNEDDNCPNTPNFHQIDTGGALLGDACEDRDGDGITDELDVCPDHSNLNSDLNNNGIDDVCDPSCVIDDNGDIECLIDTDLDGFTDVNDNCPLVPNHDQRDSNFNGLGDACDDRDRDGIIDAIDLCPRQHGDPDNLLLDQIDSNNNGIGDACDFCWILNVQNCRLSNIGEVIVPLLQLPVVALDRNFFVEGNRMNMTYMIGREENFVLLEHFVVSSQAEILFRERVVDLEFEEAGFAQVNMEWDGRRVDGQIIDQGRHHILFLYIDREENASVLRLPFIIR